MRGCNTWPRIYTQEELVRYSAMLTEEFVERRSKEEESLAGYYHARFISTKSEVERVLDETDDLLHLVESGQSLLLDGLLPVIRGMTRPSVSEDDFKNLSDTGTVSASRFADNALAASALGYIARNLNHDLFPWVSKGEHPTTEQRHAACVSVAALMAEQKTKTSMRGNASKLQEKAVRDALEVSCGLRVVKGSNFDMIQNGPAKGEKSTSHTSPSTTFHEGRFRRSVAQAHASDSTYASPSKPACSRPRASPPPPANSSMPAIFRAGIRRPVRPRRTPRRA